MGAATPEAGIKYNSEDLRSTRNNRRGIARQWSAGIIASLGMWATGSALGWSSPSVPQLEGDKGIESLTKDEIAWATSVLMLAALPGCFLGGYFSDKYGRRTVSMIAVFPFTLGWGLIAGAQNAWMLIVGRIIVGVSSGTYTVTSSVFCAEIANDKLRSRLAAWNVVALCLGILYAYIIGAIVSWRINTIICGATPLLHLLGMLFIPETPRFLASKGNVEKASSSLRWFRGGITEAEVQSEMETFLSANENTSRTEEEGFKSNQKLLDGSTVKPVLICLACSAFQQLSGTTAVTFYTVDIFETSGSNVEPNIAAILYGATQAIFTGFAGVLMTRFGRKPLFIFSEIGMAGSLAILGGFYYLKECGSESVQYLGWVPLASLMIYTITYCCGAGILPWTLMADLCPPHVKGITSAMCTATSCGLGFLVGLVFPRMLDGIGGYGAFWLFSGICCVGAVFMTFVLPETKDKTMEEIMNLFKKPNESASHAQISDKISDAYPLNEKSRIDDS